MVVDESKAGSLLKFGTVAVFVVSCCVVFLIVLGIIGGYVFLDLAGDLLEATSSSSAESDPAWERQAILQVLGPVQPPAAPEVQSSSTYVPPWNASPPSEPLPPGHIPAFEVRPPMPEPNISPIPERMNRADPLTHRPLKNPGRITSDGPPPSAGGESFD